MNVVIVSTASLGCPGRNKETICRPLRARTMKHAERAMVAYLFSFKPLLRILKGSAHDRKND